MSHIALGVAPQEAEEIGDCGAGSGNEIAEPRISRAEQAPQYAPNHDAARDIAGPFVSRYRWEVGSQSARYLSLKPQQHLLIH